MAEQNQTTKTWGPVIMGSDGSGGGGGGGWFYANGLEPKDVAYFEMHNGVPVPITHRALQARQMDRIEATLNAILKLLQERQP